MKSKIILLIIFFAGLSLGWLTSRAPSPVTPENRVEIEVVEDQNDSIVAVDKEKESFDPQILFFEIMSQSGFQMGDYYESVRTQLDDSQQDALDQQMLNYAELVFSRRHEDRKTDQKLEALIGNFSTDKVIHEKLAEVYAENKDYVRAINMLAEVKRLTQFTEDYVAINNKIIEFVDQNSRFLVDTKQLAKQEEFYKYLMEKFPGEYEFKWRYANFAYQEKKYEYAAFLLEDLRYLPEFSARAVLLAEKIDFHLNGDSAAGVVVNLLRQGDSYVVKALVNDHEPVSLLIDTGASMTVISSELAYSLGLMDFEPEMTMRFQTANGEVVAPVVRLNSLRIGEYAINELQVGVLPVSIDNRMQGLLGMNFLKHFRFLIDQQNATLELMVQH